MPRLCESEIGTALEALPDWRREGDAIMREIGMKGFMRPMLLANAVAHLAETANHHPDLTIRYGSLAVLLTTHDAGGLTERDFALARRIDELIAPTSPRQ